MMERSELASRFNRAQERAAASPARVERRTERLLAPDVPSFAEIPVSTGKIAGPVDAVIYGIPYEGFIVRDPRNFYPPGTCEPPGSTGYSRSGAWLAPNAIRAASQFFSLDHANGLLLEHGLALGENLTLLDAGNCDVGKQSPEELLEWVPAEVAEFVRAGAVPMVIGGDHLVPLFVIAGIFAATGKKLGVITYDAHLDLSWEPRYWAGSQWARAMEMGALDPRNLVHIGIRGARNSVMWTEASKELGLHPYTMDEVVSRGLDAVTDEAIETALDGCDAIYLSVDVDALDPSSCPDQKYPEPGGLSGRELLYSLRRVAAQKICGFDFCCLGPTYDHAQIGTALAARSMIEVLAGIAGDD